MSLQNCGSIIAQSPNKQISCSSGPVVLGNISLQFVPSVFSRPTLKFSKSRFVGR